MNTELLRGHAVHYMALLTAHVSCAHPPPEIPLPNALHAVAPAQMAPLISVSSRVQPRSAQSNSA